MDWVDPQQGGCMGAGGGRAGEERALLPPPPLPQYEPGKGALHLPTAVIQSPKGSSTPLEQTLDLVQELGKRGIPAGAAAAYLDSSPQLEFRVWHRVGGRGGARASVELGQGSSDGRVCWLEGACSSAVDSPPRLWSSLTLLVKACPPGTRQVRVSLWGGSPSPAGQGQPGVEEGGRGCTSFAGPTLRLLPPGAEHHGAQWG